MEKEERVETEEKGEREGEGGEGGGEGGEGGQADEGGECWESTFHCTVVWSLLCSANTGIQVDFHMIS